MQPITERINPYTDGGHPEWAEKWKKYQKDDEMAATSMVEPVLTEVPEEVD